MAEIIQTPIHAARHFVVVELTFDENITYPDAGFESNYQEMIDWCSKNISNKWYSAKQQETVDPRHKWTQGQFGTRDIADICIFNFEDPNDKAHFILKWM